MALGLREDLHFCQIGERLLFLDVRRDQYFALSAASERAFLAYLSEPARVQLSEMLSPLTEQGLLIERNGHDIRPCRSTAVTASCLDAAIQRPPLPSILVALWALFRARLWLRWGSLASSIQRLADRKQQCPPLGEQERQLSHWVAAFDRAARLARSHDQCLIRSLALAQILAARQIDHDFVMAVRLRPFAAHSWVQQGGSVLNDHVDAVRSFTPILVL